MYYTEEDLDKMSDEDLRMLLASGVRGKQYKLVFKKFMERNASRKGLFDYQKT